MQYFNIQVASQLSGVASATIRAWEKRYNAVVPERAENKHRLYSENDIEKLALLYKLTEFGQSIGKIAHLDLANLKEIYTRLLHRPYVEREVVTPNHEKIDYEKILANLYLALQAYKLDILSHELEKAKTILNPREFCLNVIVPIFKEIGGKVERKELTVGQEHTLSAIASFHMGHVIGLHYQNNFKNEELVLITSPEGELHEIGILASSLLCVYYGVRFIYLGTNMPAASLAEAANALHSKAILLGVTKGHQISENQNLEEYLNIVRANLQGKVAIWVGGNVKASSRSELEKKRINYFPSLQALDEFLAKI